MALLTGGAVRRFRQEHGAPETWGPGDYEVYQDLVAHRHVSARARRLRLRRVWLRSVAVTACVLAGPLYLPGRLVDRVDDWLSDLEDRVDAAGDREFGQRLGAATDRVTGAVDRLLTRITGRAAI